MLVSSFFSTIQKMTLEEFSKSDGNPVILVPTFDLYNQVQGELLIQNITNVRVSAMFPPAAYTSNISNIPGYITDDKHEAMIRKDSPDKYLTYFVRKV